MAPPEPLLPSSAFYQTILGSSSDAIASIFKGLPTERYILWIWVSILQVIEAWVSQKKIMCPERIRRDKREEITPPDHTLTMYVKR